MCIINQHMSSRTSLIVKIAFLAAFAFGTTVVLFLLYGYTKQSETENTTHATEYLPTITFTVGTSTLQAEVVQSTIDRMRGLSGRVVLEQDAGMFFVFPRAGKHGIWMKEMQFPIDIIWLDEDLRVVTIAERVHPDTFPESFYPDEVAHYVLEVNAGYTAVHGIVPGIQLTVQERNL